MPGPDVDIGPPDALEGAPGREAVDDDAHWHASRATIAIGHVGDVLTAPEPTLEKVVDEPLGRLPVRWVNSLRSSRPGR